MSRHRPSCSYGHSIRLISDDHWRLYWMVDRYYEGDRLRHTTGASRDTDMAGAIRFCKRWKLPLPPPSPETK